jgi:hypothetical protein
LSDANSPATRSFVFGTSTINFTTIATASFGVIATGMTMSAASATFVFQSASTSTRTFAGAGFSYGTLTYTVANSPGALVITGANTFNTLNIGSGRVLTMPSSTTNTFTQFNATGVNNGYEYLSASAGNFITTPDSAPLSITGDIDIRCRVALDNWAGTGLVVTKNAALFSYQFSVQSGQLVLDRTADGSTVLTGGASITTLSVANGVTAWIRATWRQSDGRMQFFTAPGSLLSPVASDWTQLGSDRSTVTTATNDSVGTLEIGSRLGGSIPGSGKYYRAQIRNNILNDDTGIVFDADFTTKAFGANSFVESSANAATVTISGAVAQAGDGRMLLNSSVPGTKATVTKASGTVATCNYLTIQDSAATGATWFAGVNSVNAGNNSGWIFSNAPAAGVSSNFLPFFGGSF